MTDVGVIDQFFAVFSRYIDTGFGLVRGDVASLATLLVAIDVTLAALFWAWSPGEEILARLVKKTLYVGFFAFLLTDFANLARIVMESFSGLGLKAAGAALDPEDLMRPGRIAQTGVEAVRPLLEACGELAGFPAIFENFVQIAVMLAAALVILVAFFVLAVQLFVVVIEFKLTTLAGFVLVPFGLFGRTAFLAERVLGNVVASGVKVLVLAVVVGIGSTLFDGFVSEFAGDQPTLDQVMAIAVGALCLLGLGIFGPGVATGLVSGAPQLGAGAAVGAALTAGGLAAVGAAGIRSAAGAARGVGAHAAGVVARAGPPGGGPHGGAQAGGGGPESPEPASPGGRGPVEAAEPGSDSRPSVQADPGEAPAWARRLRAGHVLSGGVNAVVHAIRSGDRSGGGASVPLSEEKP